MTLSYHNGSLLPAEDLQLSLADLGFIMGATVSERLRTFAGQLFQLQQHMERLQQSLAMVGIDTPETIEELTAAAEELARINHQLLDPADDLGMYILVTPGLAGQAPRRPTVIIGTAPLEFSHWSDAYREGTALVASSYRQVPASSWHPHIKCRSRMHYFLADQEAERVQPGARALLLDQQENVGEVSTANVVIYREREGLVSPRREGILAGISLDVLEELAASLSIPFTESDLSLSDLAAADEVLLTSTSPCVWSVTGLDGRPIGDGRVGPRSGQLLAAWSALVGVDIAGQAGQFAGR
jgi:branched-subunit amino acid aminotransferase/4-amino-4-deoxychorismate lyase